MKTSITQWGNSAAVRIPAVLIQKLKLEKGQEVELYEQDGVIVIAPMHEDPCLEDLIAQITPENLHQEVSFGSPVGQELL